MRKFLRRLLRIVEDVLVGAAVIVAVLAWLVWCFYPWPAAVVGCLRWLFGW